MYPRQYFTRERLEKRVPNEPPPVLFHFTRSLDNALKILEAGYLHGRPEISTTENPAFIVPGPIVFIFDPKCIMAAGFRLWPCIWQKGAEDEAEWAIISQGAKVWDDCSFDSSPVDLSLNCVEEIGFMPGWARKDVNRIILLAEAAEKRNIPTREYNWEDWWSDKGPKWA